jgi:hypothetical protein
MKWAMHVSDGTGSASRSLCRFVFFFTSYFFTSFSSLSKDIPAFYLFGF